MADDIWYFSNFMDSFHSLLVKALKPKELGLLNLRSRVSVVNAFKLRFWGQALFNENQGLEAAKLGT